MKKVERILKKCPCGKDILVPIYLYKRKKYCSKTCLYIYRIKSSGFKRIDKTPNPSWFKKGHTMNKGKHSKFRKEFPGYDAIHDWIERWKTDPKECEFCGSKNNLEWSNKSEKYLRDLDDWQRLCKKCHCRYDFENFGKRKEFYR